MTDRLEQLRNEGEISSDFDPELEAMTERHYKEFKAVYYSSFDKEGIPNEEVDHVVSMLHTMIGNMMTEMVKDGMLVTQSRFIHAAQAVIAEFDNMPEVRSVVN